MSPSFKEKSNNNLINKEYLSNNNLKSETFGNINTHDGVEFDNKLTTARFASEIDNEITEHNDLTNNDDDVNLTQNSNNILKPGIYKAKENNDKLLEPTKDIYGNKPNKNEKQYYFSLYDTKYK